MMNSERPSYSRLATDVLASANVEPAPVSKEVDAMAIAAIAGAIRETNARRKRKRVGLIVGGLALAAGVALAVGFGRKAHDTPPLATNASPQSTAAQAPQLGNQAATATAQVAATQAAPERAPETTPEGASAPAKQGPQPVKPKQDVAAGNAPTTAGPSPIAASDLAAQNAVLARAAAARRRGDRAGAVAAYDEFLAHYPGSTQAETAEVERMKVLSSIDAARGKAAADDYLRRHPKGYARDEARLLAGAGIP